MGRKKEGLAYSVRLELALEQLFNRALNSKGGLGVIVKVNDAKAFLKECQSARVSARKRGVLDYDSLSFHHDITDPEGRVWIRVRPNYVSHVEEPPRRSPEGA